MKIICLMENTSENKNMHIAHGLSLYVQTKNHNILFDSGPDDNFAVNAQRLGIDLKNVDIFVLSHGHYDHGGGLKRFMHINKRAKMYIHKNAFDAHYALDVDVWRYNGLDRDCICDERMFFTDGVYEIDDSLVVFSGVKGKEFYSHANDTLFSLKNGVKIKDEFEHEQNLIICENGKYLLIGGCAHCGIVNIMEKFKSITGRYPDYAISGFHLYNPSLLIHW